MDTSKEYIGMCAKATEVQKFFKHGDGSYIHNPSGEIQNILYLKLPDGGEWANPHHGNLADGFIWLPRQDQLQEIMGFVACKGSVQRLSRFFIEQSPHVHSMEQLWLAFVMKTLYQKTWDGKEWMV
jgi:hypothetical protein